MGEYPVQISELYSYFNSRVHRFRSAPQSYLPELVSNFGLPFSHVPWAVGKLQGVSTLDPVSPCSLYSQLESFSSPFRFISPQDPRGGGGLLAPRIQILTQNREKLKLTIKFVSSCQHRHNICLR